MVEEVTVYIRNNSNECRKLINFMDESNMHYHLKNISKDQKYLEQLQENGVFATPAIFVDDVVILGYQKNKLKQTLGMTQSSHYRTIL